MLPLAGNDNESPALNSFPQKTQDAAARSFLPEELSYLMTAFLPSQPTTLRSKAYLALSSFCQEFRNSCTTKGEKPDSATESLARAFTPFVAPQLADNEERVLLAGISFLTALFQVDWESASSIFQQNGAFDFLMDSVDLAPSPQLSLHVAHLLGQVSGHKPCRAVITPQAVQWLEFNTRQTSDISLRAAAAIALVKFSQGTSVDNAESTGPEDQAVEGKSKELAELMKGIVINGEDKSSTMDAIEGLAYLSVYPAVKEGLSRDSIFLSHMFALVPRRKVASSLDPQELNNTLLYGILVIVSNICAYRPRLTQEQSQIERLKRMASTRKGAAQGDDHSSALDDDKHVKDRVRSLVAAGVLDVFASAVPGIESLGIRINAGKALLGIVEDKENRGKVLQSGGAKTLARIIKHSTSPPTSGSAAVDVVHLQPIQALAKLAITSSPVQVFGPNTGAMYDAIRPFSIMLLHPLSTLLQQFEALMALTNLSSQSPESASRVAKAEGLMNKVELLLLEEHPFVRRAAMELLCNLIAGSDEIFQRYGGTGDVTGTKSKLQVLVALSDVDDTPTRIAASGALATLTTSQSVCRTLVALQLERGRVLSILAQLVDIPDGGDTDENLESQLGLVHRGLVCIRNFLLSVEGESNRKEVFTEAEKAGLPRALLKLAKGLSGRVEDTILNLTAETLKSLVDMKQ